jgi:hypothetical protein
MAQLTKPRYSTKPVTIPQEFDRLLDLFPVGVLIWQLSGGESRYHLLLRSYNYMTTVITGTKTLRGKSHGDLFPDVHKEVYKKKIEATQTGISFTITVRYEDEDIPAGDFEIYFFRIHPELYIMCQFCTRVGLLTLENLNTVQFSKEAIHFMLTIKDPELQFLETLIMNILAELENYSCIEKDPKADSLSVMEFNDLIRNLARDDEQNMDFVDTFLRSFLFVGLDQSYVLYRLILRYIIAGSNNYLVQLESGKTTSASRLIIQYRVINVIKRWLTKYSFYFYREQNMLETLKLFIKYTIRTDPNGRWQKGILEIISSIEMEIEKLKRENDPFLDGCRIPSKRLPPLHPKASLFLIYKARNVSFSAFGKALGQMLTIKVNKLYRKVELIDLYDKLKNKSSNDSNVAKLIKHSTRLSYWIATLICTEQLVSNRAEIMRIFISAADWCLSENNFETAFAIYGGLSLGPVDRLASTWQHLLRPSSVSFRKLMSSRQSPIREQWLQLCSFCSVKNNYVLYRTKLASVVKAASLQGVKPVIPAYVVLSKDLAFINENENLIQPRMSRWENTSYDEVQSNSNSHSPQNTDDSTQSLDSSSEDSLEFRDSFEGKESELDTSRKEGFDFSVHEGAFSTKVLLGDTFAKFQKTDSINFFKLQQISHALSVIEHFQLSVYDFEIDTELEKCFDEADVADEDELYDMSYAVFPRTIRNNAIQ